MLILGMPAARVGDMCTWVGPPGLDREEVGDGAVWRDNGGPIRLDWGPSVGAVVVADPDPDELRIFLRTCDPEQLPASFGPITAVGAENEDAGRALRFTLSGGDLVTESIDLNEAPPAPARLEEGRVSPR